MPRSTNVRVRPAPHKRHACSACIAPTSQLTCCTDPRSCEIRKFSVEPFVRAASRSDSAAGSNRLRSFSSGEARAETCMNDHTCRACARCVRSPGARPWRAASLRLLPEVGRSGTRSGLPAADVAVLVTAGWPSCSTDPTVARGAEGGRAGGPGRAGGRRGRPGRRGRAAASGRAGRGVRQPARRILARTCWPTGG